MVNQEKLHFLIPIVGYLIIIILMAMLIFNHTALYDYAGWTKDEEFLGLMAASVSLGIVLPLIMIGINSLGIFTMEKFKKSKKLIGIVDILMSVILVVIAFVFVAYTVEKGHDNPADELVYFSRDAAYLTISAIIGIISAIGGLMIFRNNFLFWK